MKVLTLAPGREPRKLTAARPSRTLGEHEDAFKSRNGFEVEPPPDTSGEISGIISEVMQLQFVTRKEIMEAGRLIKNLGIKRTPLSVAARQVYKALGYVDYQDAMLRNGNPDRFENLNYHRKDLAAINQEINTREKATIDNIIAFIRPYFERVAELPFERELFAGPKAKSSQEFHARLRPYLDKLGWEFDDAKEFWNVAHAFSFRYSNHVNLSTKKDLFRNKELGTRKQAFDASRLLAIELGWHPKPKALHSNIEQ